MYDFKYLILGNTIVISQNSVEKLVKFSQINAYILFK